MSTARTFIKNCVANYGRTIYRAFIGVVTIGIIARYLTPYTFGQYAYIVALVAVFKMMPGMGMPMILTREVARDKTRASILLASALTIQSALSVITMAIVGIIFYIIAPSKEVYYAALICALSMILESCKFLFSAVFQAFERMEFDTLQTIVTQSLYLIFLFVFTGTGYGLQGIFFALLLGQLTGAIFGYSRVAKIFVTPKFKEVGSFWKFLIKEAYPLGIKRVLRKLSLRIDTLILAAMRSSAEVGIFHGSYKIIQSLNFITDASSQAMFPVFSRFSVSSKQSLDLSYQKSVKFVLLIGLPVAIFLSSFSRPAITLILGDKYIESASVLQMLGWVLGLMFLTSFMEKILVAGNKQYLVTVTTAIALAVKILLDFLLIPKMSYTGASIAALVSESVLLVLSFYFIYKQMGLVVTFPTVVKPLCAGLATYGLLLMFRDVNLFVGGLIEILVYSGILIGLRTFSREEIDFFKDLLRGFMPEKPIRA